MTAASGLATGPRPQPVLAAEAVTAALRRAGLPQAGHVLLFLTRDFQPQAPAALRAAARAAGCLEISGCTAYGLITDQGWQLEQSAAAALVIAAPGTPVEPAETTHSPRLAFSRHTTLPHAWQALPARAGLLDNDAVVWAHGRPNTSGQVEIPLPGFTHHLAISTGLRPLGQVLRVDRCRAYDLLCLAGQPARDSLRRSLPGERRQNLPLHRLVALRQAGQVGQAVEAVEVGVAILSANDDGSLTMAEAFAPGDTLQWAIRQPLGAEQDMNEALAVAVNRQIRPEFAVMFSCIGRGPLFYGDDDRDLLAFRQHFPDTPLIGAYGSAQIARSATGNRLFQNSVITLLCENAHV